MERKTVWQKIIASVLVIALTAGNLMLIGSNMISYAEANLESQNERTQSGNVEFGAYFKSEGRKIHSLICNVNDMAMLNIHLNVKKEGFLKNGQIEIQGANYAVKSEFVESEIIEEKTENVLKLNQINYGTEETIVIPLSKTIEDYYLLEENSKDSTVILRGTYVTIEGKEEKIEKEVTIHLGWEGKAEVEGKSEISLYQSYEDGEQKGIILEEKITVEKTNKSLPISKTTIEVAVPEYEGEKPEKVRVNSITTEMTNGKKEEEVEYTVNYEKEKEIVRIETENKAEEGRVWSKEGGKDEYRIYYEYGEKAYEKRTEAVEINRRAEITVESYTEGEMQNEAKVIEEKETLTEEIGSIISGEICIKEAINKAKMYANQNSEEKSYETEYETKESIYIARVEGIEGIKIEEGAKNFYTAEGEAKSSQIEGKEYTYYKASTIKEANKKNLLGEDGYIIIRNEAGEEIGRIDKQTEAKDGIYQIEYENPEGKIEIETSKPEKEGTLILEHEKAIRADISYGKEEEEEFSQIGETIKVGETGKEERIEIEGRQALTEAESHLIVTSNKEEINNEKEDIEIRVEFGNKEENSILYQNPTVQIMFPKFVEEVEIKNKNLLFDEELELENSNVITSQTGEKIIEVKLKGTQTKFNTIETSNGSTLLVGATITSKEGEETGEIIANIEGNEARTEIVSNLKVQEQENDNQVDLLGTSAPQETSEGNDVRISANMKMEKDEEGKEITEIGKENPFTYYVVLKNISDYMNEDEERPKQSPDPIKNIIVKDILPEGISYTEASIRIYNNETQQYEEKENMVSYNEQTRTVTWNVGDMLYEPEARLYLTVTGENWEGDNCRREIKNKVIASYEGKENILSNEVTIDILKGKIEVDKQEEGLEEPNYAGDTVKFVLKAENVGELEEEVRLKWNLPEELEPIEKLYGKGEELTSTSFVGREVSETVTLAKGETFTIQITAKIAEFDMKEGETYRNIEISAVVNEEQAKWNMTINGPRTPADIQITKQSANIRNNKQNGRYGKIYYTSRK